MRVFGRIDILINNAALTVKGGGDRAADYFAPFETIRSDLWEEALRVNLTGAFLCCQAVGKQMVAQRSRGDPQHRVRCRHVSPDHRIYEGVKSPHTGTPFNTPVGVCDDQGGRDQPHALPGDLLGGRRGFA